MFKLKVILFVLIFSFQALFTWARGISIYYTANTFAKIRPCPS
jgi:hypothetical protein